MHAAADKPERLTWTEICKRYPNQWVILVHYDIHSHNYMSIDYVVFGHSPTRKEALDLLGEAIRLHGGAAFYSTRPVRAMGPLFYPK